MLFFADPGEGAVSQAMLMGAVTSVLVVLLLLLVTLNRPYQSGVRGLQPDAMERSLDMVSKALTEIDAWVLARNANGLSTGFDEVEDASTWIGSVTRSAKVRTSSSTVSLDKSGTPRRTSLRSSAANQKRERSWNYIWFLKPARTSVSANTADFKR